MGTKWEVDNNGRLRKVQDIKLTPQAAPTPEQGLMYFDNISNRLKVSNDGVTFNDAGAPLDNFSVEENSSDELQVKGFEAAATDQIPVKQLGGSIAWEDKPVIPVGSMSLLDFQKGAAILNNGTPRATNHTHVVAPGFTGSHVIICGMFTGNRTQGPTMFVEIVGDTTFDTFSMGIGLGSASGGGPKTFITIYTPTPTEKTNGFSINLESSASAANPNMNYLSSYVMEVQ